ncbi:hypothetical protein ACH47C_00955 [Streptomyces rishiriensis]|uniref:hypothetical protein n=1 Tax=Streptomyces rishiriensis TaxID=68264 RepID=UPI0033DBF32F
MAEAPSEEEMLKAVERHVSRPGAAAHLTVPGAAALSWQSVLECRIVRSVERRTERPMRVKGRRGAIAGRPTYTDLDTHPVAPPDDPGTARRIELVREGSPAEEPCGDCVDGKRECPGCAGRGGSRCARYVECDVCQGGPDACWECDGTGHPRTRRARPHRPRTEGAQERAPCKRCRRPDVACPKCLGERQLKCPACAGTGRAVCGTCKGAKRLRHEKCGGAGLFTVWTEGVITHTPAPDGIKPVYPPLTRLRADGAGRWHTAVLSSPSEELPEFLEDAQAKRIAPLLAETEGEVRRRVELRCLPLARVVVRTDPDRVYYAFPGAAGIEVIGRPSRQRLTALAWAAVAVAALVAVVSLTLLR